jgi:sortase A
MKRRRFLTLVVAGSAWSVVGCGRQETSVSAEATPTPTTVATAADGASAGAPLVAPPLAAKPNPINEGATHLPNRIEIPAIDVDIPVVELGWSQSEEAGQIFSEWDVAAYAAGWHINSALPGAGGNVVLSGHNNVLGAVFRELDQLKQGDPITVWMNNRLYRYAVEQVVVLPDKGISDEQRVANTRWIGPFDEERLTLVSCWPRNNNTHRIVVVALPQQVARATQ